MKVIHGQDATIFFKKGEEYVPYGCLETVEITISTEYKSVKTIGDGMWSKVRAQRHSFRITGSGLVQYDDDTRFGQFDLLDHQVQGVHVEYMMTFKENDGATDITMIYGTALPVNNTLGAPNDFVNASFELVGHGAPTIGIMPTCEKEIRSMTISRQGLTLRYSVAILTLDSGTVPRYDWRLDNGGINTALSTGWTMNMASDTSFIYGTHTLEIWPVCENGARGTKTTKTFNVSIG